MRKLSAITVPAILLLLLAAQFTGCEKYVLPELSITPDTLVFSSAIETKQFFVHTNTITTAEADNAAWIRTDPAWMDADTTVSVSVGHYIGSSQRTATIIVKSETLERILVVIQKADPEEDD